MPYRNIVKNVTDAAKTQVKKAGKAVGKAMTAQGPVTKAAMGGMRKLADKANNIKTKSVAGVAAQSVAKAPKKPRVIRKQLEHPPKPMGMASNMKAEREKRVSKSVSRAARGK